MTAKVSSNEYYSRRINELKSTLSKLKKKQKDDLRRERTHALCILGGEIAYLLGLKEFDERSVEDVKKIIQKNVAEIKKLLTSQSA